MQLTPQLVDTRNAVNARAMVIQCDLAQLLAPYLGRKARKVSGYGGWVAALAKELEQYQSEQQAEGFRCWLRVYHSWITLEVDTTCRTADGGAVQYVKANLSVGKVDESGVLLELFDLQQLRTDYSQAEIEAKRANAYELERQARELRSELRDFER